MDLRSLNNPGSVSGIIGYIIGYGIGFGTAVYLLERKLKNKYDLELAKEINNTRLFYKSLQKPETVQDLEPELYSAIVSSYDGSVEEEDADEVQLVISETLFPDQPAIDDKAYGIGSGRQVSYTNVFPSDDVEFYVYTFYREDGVICNEDGQILVSPNDVLGVEAVLLLDKIPLAQRSVYIYDAETNTTWNVDLVDGAYADVYLKHGHISESRRRATRRFRLGDE